MNATLLIEIGVEELPPRAMRGLMDAFADGITAGLDEVGLPHGDVSRYASPRRLAMAVATTDTETAAREIKKSGPTVAIAFDAQGNPQPAAEGFARSCGVTVDALEQADSSKGKRLVYRGRQAGESLTDILPAIVAKVLHQLPIPKRMRWGDSDAEFVRPVHRVVAMHGEQTLPLDVFGIQAGNHTYGHRFHHPDAITLSHADEYAQKLLAPGYVIADVDQRRQRIHEQLTTCAQALAGTALIDPALLDEVT